MVGRSSILDEVDPPGGAVGTRLRAMVDGGGGLVFVPGNSRAETWPAEWRALLPATIGGIKSTAAPTPAERCRRSTTRIRSSSCSTRREAGISRRRSFYRYRALTPATGASVSARFDDGVAGARRTHRRQGQGARSGRRRSINTGRTCRSSRCFSRSSISSGSTPVATPIRVHGSSRAKSLDLSRHGELTAPFIGRTRCRQLERASAEAPSGARERLTATGANHLVTLREQGFYELGGRDTPVGSGRPIAVNVDPAESDLSHLDPQDIVVAVTSVDGQRQPGSDFDTATPQDQESRQKIWWYLLLGALLLMAVETAMSNRLSRVSSS